MPNVVGSYPNPSVVANDCAAMPSLMALDTTNFLGFTPSNIIDLSWK